MQMEPYVLSFTEIGLNDVKRVGGKNASLGELYRGLASEGIRVPGGFVVTVAAYQDHLTRNRLREPITDILRDLDVRNVNDLRERARRIREMVIAAPIPDEIEREIIARYDQFCTDQACIAGVAVRSSATAEDLPEASFAGQQETYLNVQGPVRLIEACKRCFASLFTDRAIAYRHGLGINDLDVGLSIGIQTMVRADLACAGVMFSIDTESGFRDTVLINAAYGLGETVVQGTVNPDEFMVFKPTLFQDYKPILRRKLGSKEFKVVYDIGGEKGTKVVPVSRDERKRFALSDAEILTLARWATVIERHYSHQYHQDIPMDIEWAKDGISGQLFIVQARPETVQSRRSRTTFERFHLRAKGPVLATGRSVGNRIGRGPARVIRDVKDLDSLQNGEVLVTERTDPDWEPVMKRAAAIVTDQGGRTCHAAIVSRELGIPAVVGAESATRLIPTGSPVTVSCAEGDSGFVYEGLLDFEVETVDISTLPRTNTKVMMNIANPDEALHLAQIPNDGVGLAREEFIVSHHVQIHPMALAHFDRVESISDRTRILALTEGYSDLTRYFVDRLAEGVGMIAAAFFPKDVIARFSDFKTNEYSHLLGGGPFEPKEENPMLGFRGASRYYNDLYKEGFALECLAMRKVRDEMGLKNLKLMIPFCRTLEEGRRVLEEMKKNGLERGKDGLEVYVMCEIPSNVILADRFADLFDGFSIGSNDLTQLVLGVDRDSNIVSHLFDERDPAVKETISALIQVAHRKGRKVGICGQAPSDFPEFVDFLVKEGINSLSLNSDAVLTTTMRVHQAETDLVQKPTRHRPTSQKDRDKLKTEPPRSRLEGNL